MTSLEIILTLWQHGHVTEGEVREWAWNQVGFETEPSYELIELATDGPMSCLKRAAEDFLSRPIDLTYAQEFSLRAVRTSLQSDASVLMLINWAAKRAMGEEISDPMVQLAYQWDHLINDCDDTAAAVALARKSLPQLLTRCHTISAPFSASGEITLKSIPQAPFHEISRTGV